MPGNPRFTHATGDRLQYGRSESNAVKKGNMFAQQLLNGITQETDVSGGGRIYEKKIGLAIYISTVHT